MKTRMILILVALLMSGALSTCSPSQADLDVTATAIAANLFATQTAAAPTPTPAPTSTPTPTPPPTPTPTPVPIRLEADGSGDYPSLEEAVQHVPEETTIVLGPGTYRLAEPLDIRKPLRLVGAGMDQTEIVSEAEGYVVGFSGDGLFATEDITFRHQGTAAASVVIVAGGEIAFARCRFTGAVQEEKEDRAGLWLQGNTTGVVRECEAVENDNVGIYVGEQAQPTLEGNVCTDNEVVGIGYVGNSGGVARQNECSGNRGGIYVTEQAQPTLEGNVSTDNETAGIGYVGDSGGVARQNECVGSLSGIHVGEQAQPTLEGNVCTDNEQAGIAYWDNADGVARQNECSGNWIGIYLAETVNPDLVDNDCHDNLVEMMVEIPAGPFTMGNDNGDDDEAPAHEVDLPTFQIDRFEVTNAEFALFVLYTGYVTDAEKSGLPGWRAYAKGKGTHPVVYVGWNDANAYCVWEGKRLPTEAEWEKAARGTDGHIYPWGDDWDPTQANFRESGLRGTVAVGSFSTEASPYEVEDMAGNVWEWTADWYEPYPGCTFQSDYFGQKYRVLRGGGWFDDAEQVRAINRNAGDPTTTFSDDIGFRCAR
jgi:parallel beta-helix repeat protein